MILPWVSFSVNPPGDRLGRLRESDPEPPTFYNYCAARETERERCDGSKYSCKQRTRRVTAADGLQLHAAADDRRRRAAEEERFCGFRGAILWLSDPVYSLRSRLRRPSRTVYRPRTRRRLPSLQSTVGPHRLLPGGEPLTHTRTHTQCMLGLPASAAGIVAALASGYRFECDLSSHNTHPPQPVHANGRPSTENVRQ